MSGVGANRARGGLGTLLRRHLDGWPLGALALGLALLGVALFLPRAARSFVLPAPQVDWLEARQLGVADEQLAELARNKQLPFEVRAVGEWLRRYGNQEYARLATTADQLEVRRRAAVALKSHGVELLLELRALQLQLFLSAVERFRATEQADSELIELGGDFAQRAAERGWLSVVTGSARTANPYELATLFRTRWLKLVGFDGEPAFRLTLNEWRIYYGFLLRQLEPSAASSELGLGYVEALLRRDGAYPAALAKGVLYLRQQAYPLAIEALQQQLELEPHGPWELRTRNYLTHALRATAPSAD